MKKLNILVDKLLKPLSYKYGITEATLKLHWKDILHEPLSIYSTPYRISYNQFNKKNTLYISVGNGSIALEIKYIKLIIIEKIAQIFGYKIVHDIKVRQSLNFV